MSGARGAASWDAERPSDVAARKHLEARIAAEDECARLRELLADTETEKIERGTEILRLREQLDAARVAFEQIESEAEAFLADNLAPNMSMIRVRDRARFARAALGVEGEQEKP